MSVINLVKYYESVVKQSSGLQAVIPGGKVRLYWEWAPGDDGDEYSTIFPYLVWKIDIEDPIDPWGMHEGLMKFSLWDYSPNGLRIMQMRQALINLLERRFYEEPEGIKALRIWKNSDTCMSDTTDHEKVWRRDIIFSMRFFDQSTVEAVNARILETGGH